VVLEFYCLFSEHLGVELTTYHPCSAESQEIRGCNLPGTTRATSACCGRPLLTVHKSFFFFFKCYIVHASWYILITWTNKMHYFLLICFNSKPLHVSSRLAALQQEDQLFINSSLYSLALCWLAAGRIVGSSGSGMWGYGLVRTGSG